MEPGFALSEIDTTTPHPARIYDALLGGRDNYAADRDAVRRLLKAAPEVRDSARANRAFLRRAVRFLAADAGIRQFIDVGIGIPSAGNVHQVAGEIAPGSRVVYVDNDRCKSGCAHASGSAQGALAAGRVACQPPRGLPESAFHDVHVHEPIANLRPM
jgi:hypothetical protein